TLHAIEELPGVGAVTGPYGGTGPGQISEDGHTAYATVTFDRPADEIPASQAQALVDTAKGAEADGLQVELGGTAVALTEAPSVHLAEGVGVIVAAV
ncbi:MMPL family transporter, partial [Streptomyces sp. SID7499]|nr:MMPL family transporter [Streptomyces sp. SID7499]